MHFNDVVAFVTDNAAYMKKCFRDSLRGILPNAVHVTCWAHILSLVGDEFCGALRPGYAGCFCQGHVLQSTRTSC